MANQSHGPPGALAAGIDIQDQGPKLEGRICELSAGSQEDTFVYSFVLLGVNCTAAVA